MKRLKQFFQTISLRSFLVVVLAGFLLLSTTACQRGQAATPLNPRTNPPAASDRSGQGMYPTTDTATRNPAAEAKADRLVRDAERRLQKVQSPSEIVDEVTPLDRQAEDAGRNIKRNAEDIGRSAKRTAEDVGDATRRGTRNLKRNTEDALDRAGNAVDRATDRAGNAVDRTTDRTANSIHRATPNS